MSDWGWVDEAPLPRAPGASGKVSRNRAIVEAVERGESKRAIARRLGVSAKRVRRICEQQRRGEAIAAGWEGIGNV